LELLGLPGYGFKFFLWDQIEPFFRSDARPDRVPQYELKWTRNSLKEVLSKRLSSFSDGKVTAFDSLLEEPCGIDDHICLMANGSPRNLIRLCERILAIQGVRDPNAAKIAMAAIDQASVAYSEQICIENYGENITRKLQRVGRELFTTNFIANDILKITTNGARNKITSWVKLGMVSQIGNVTIPPAIRPTHLYGVIDPCVVRVIHRAVPFEQFILDRWLPCEHCLTDNLVNIDLYPEDEDPICRQCGRKLL
jgi:hypothetical protein